MAFLTILYYVEISYASSDTSCIPALRLGATNNQSCPHSYVTLSNVSCKRCGEKKLPLDETHGVEISSIIFSAANLEVNMLTYASLHMLYHLIENHFNY